jgi:hypothetical protein
MLEPSAVGSPVVAIHHQTLSWAVHEVCRTLPIEDVHKLKIRSGEHIGTMLTTAFLGCAPIGIDSAGQLDLAFDLTRSTRTPSSLGLADRHFADFELKSLPGQGYRAFDAAIDRAVERGTDPESKTFTVVVRSANDVLVTEGRAAIDAALSQLNRKSEAGHSKNVFLIAHPLDYWIAELTDAPLLAHHLDPLVDVVGVDTVWVLWAPDCLTMWSAQDARWVNLIFTAVNQDESYQADLGGFDVLQHAEAEFLCQTENKTNSPYIYRLKPTADDRHAP